MGEKSKTESVNVEEKRTSWVPVTPEKLFGARLQPNYAEGKHKSHVHSQNDSTLQGLNDRTSLFRNGDAEPMQILQDRYQEENKDMGTCTSNLHQGKPGKVILGSNSPEISTPSKKCNAKKKVDDKSHKMPKKKKHRPKVVVEGMPKRTSKSVTRRRDTSNRDTSNKRKYTRKNKLSDEESVCKKAKRALHFDRVQECTSNNNETSTLETKTDKVMVEKTTGGACDLVAHLKNGMRVYKRLFHCLTQSRRLGPNFPNICKKRRFSKRKKATTFIPWLSVATEDSHHCYTLRNRKVSTKVSSLIKAKVRDSIIWGESSMCLVSLCNAMVKIKKKIRSHKFIRRQDMASLAAIPNCNQSPLTTFKTAAVVNTESLPPPIKLVPIVSTESLPPPVKPAPIVSTESLPSPVNPAPLMNAKSPPPPANEILTGERQGFHTPPETFDNLIHPGKCKKRVEKRQTKRGLSLVNVGSSYSKSEVSSLTLVSESEESSLALVNQTLSSQRQGVGILHGLHSLDAIVPINNKKRVSKKQSKMRPSAGCSPPETIFPTANLRDPLEWLKVFDSILQRLQGLHISNEDNENGTIVPYEGPFDPKKKRKLSAKVNLDAETLRVWNLLMVKDGREGVDNMSNEDTNKWWENERKVFTGRVDSFIARMHLIQGNRRFSAWKGSVVDSVVGVFLTQNVSDHLSSSAFMSLAAKFPIQSTSSHDACTEDGKLPNNQGLDKPNMVVEEQADDGKNEVCMNHEAENKAETLNKASRAVAYDEDSNTDKRDPTKKAKDPHEQLCSSSMDVKGEKFATRKKGETEEKKETTVDWDNLRKLYLGGQRQRSSDTTDSVDWEAVKRAQLDEVANTIRQRGQHFIIAGRIKDFLDRVVADHESIDLEWLRNVPPDDAKEFLLSICGLGSKSVECIMLLALQHVAFPVDTNVGRIAVRLGWVPLQPLPEELQIHLLKEYPLMDSIQKYLWPRLCKLDQRTLYELHYQMITFGKVFCTKRRPNCNPCPMRGECRHFASAFASAKLALPGPEEKSEVTSIVPVAVGNTYVNVLQPIISFLEANPYSKSGYQTSNCEPIIEEPTSPEPQYEDIPDIEDFFGHDSNEIPTIKLNLESFTTNLLGYMDQYGMSVQEGDFTKALVALNHEAASIPRPKLKSVSRLRTQHQVYELPDSHPILTELQLERRDPDDPCPYLLSIWLPGETANSMEPPKQRCNSQGSGDLCNEQNCFSCNSTREQNSQTTRGTILIPCRTAMRGRFPLNGTYFQVNEVFSDHESSLHPINVPTALIWNLPRRTVYCGTSATTIFREIVTEEIQQCFWKGYICVRGFERKTRAPRPLGKRFHVSGIRKAKKEKDDD